MVRAVCNFYGLNCFKAAVAATVGIVNVIINVGFAVIVTDRSKVVRNYRFIGLVIESSKLC